MVSWRARNRSGLIVAFAVAGFIAGVVLAFPTGCAIAQCQTGSPCRSHWCTNLFGWIASGWNLTFPVIGAAVLGSAAWLPRLVAREPKS